MKRLLLAIVLCGFSLPGAFANESAIRKALESKLGGARIEGVQAAPMPGLFEVRILGRDGTEIYYTDAQGNYLLDGNLYDAKSGRNLTEERLRKLTAIRFSSLPLDIAVKVQRGNGKRVLAIFSDPYCPACKTFERTLQQVDDVTVYYFMYPVIRPELEEHSKAVWCAADRGKAWLELALHGRPLKSEAKCDTPIEKVKELGKSLRVTSTPTLILPNGEFIRGGLPAPQLSSALDEAMKAKK
jgi:thiol:disulfide interchange protein DsbC